MERDREDARVAGEDRRRAVALVHVEVDDDDAQRRLGLEHAGGDRDVVEDAVAAAARGGGVVGAAGEVGGNALAKGSARRRNRRPDRAARALDHLLAPRKADRALLGRAERSARHRADIRGVVDKGQLRVARRRGLARGEVGEGRDPLAQEPVFAARKGVADGQRQEVTIGVKRLHRRHCADSAKTAPDALPRATLLECCIAAIGACNLLVYLYTSVMLQCSIFLTPESSFHHLPVGDHMMTVEQIVSVQKTNVETLFGLTTTAFEGVEKLIELNLQVAKTAMTEAAANTKAALSVKDAQELLALQSSLLQPAAEKAAAYSRYVYEIAASTGAEVTRVAEATTTDAQAKFMSIVDTAVKNAPAGTENAVALVKSAVAAANNAFESVQKATKQAAEVADANFQAMSSTAVRATKTKRAA